MLFENYPFSYRISTFNRPLLTSTTVDSPVHTHHVVDGAPKLKRWRWPSCQATRGCRGAFQVRSPIIAALVPSTRRNCGEECKAQVDDTGGLDLPDKRRIARPSLLTPTRAAVLRTINMQDRPVTFREVSSQPRDIGLGYGSNAVRWWYEKERDGNVARRIKPSLSQG